MKRTKNLETMLVITTGFVILYLFTQLKWMLTVSAFFGLTGIFIESLANLISNLWSKLSEALGYVMSRVILSLVYYLILFPISLIYRLSSKDNLQLKKKADSYFSERNHTYKAEDLKNVW